jgi:cytochrome c oxidase subunit IV
MSGHESGSEVHAVGSTRLFVISLLVVLSVVKAALIVSYFMHLKYEKIGLALLLIPAAIFCICMIIIFFMPDSARLLQMRLVH